DFEVAGDHAMKVDSEEGVLGVGHRIDQTPHQVLLVSDHGHVFATEGDDARARLAVEGTGDTVGVESGAHHQPAHSLGCTTVDGHHLGTAIAGDTGDPGVEEDPSTGGDDVVAHRIGHRHEV